MDLGTITQIALAFLLLWLTCFARRSGPHADSMMTVWRAGDMPYPTVQTLLMLLPHTLGLWEAATEAFFMGPRSLRAAVLLPFIHAVHISSVYRFVMTPLLRPWAAAADEYSIPVLCLVADLSLLSFAIILADIVKLDAAIEVICVCLRIRNSHLHRALKRQVKYHTLCVRNVSHVSPISDNNEQSEEGFSLRNSSSRRNEDLDGFPSSVRLYIEYCCICLSPLKSSCGLVRYRIRFIPSCGHGFHPRCIRRWLQLRNNEALCPVCRAHVPSTPSFRPSLPKQGVLM
ncbi:hypothetical protein KP509_35G053600 [Ceratopteris richardii]|uniref:RING-type domain-containing protein n=1 Tax=Ceratopteris richardii TaxID=49495 RepID=A0A8T2QHM6_CERRI|nr:hypothetical protein KP509_35G053600 [Ceratopteris richardii]